jgi:predicted Zn-dependent protease
MRKLDEAGDHLRRCFQEDPQNPDVLLGWATWLFAQGQTDEAAKALQRLLAVVPEQFEGQRLLGEIDLSRLRLPEALRHLESAVKQRPYDRKCRHLLGRTLQALGRAAEAKPHLDYTAEASQPLSRVADLLRLLSDRPNDARVRFEIGTTLLKYGCPEDGARWLQSVLQFQPDHPGARQALAAFYKARGDPQKTLASPERPGMNGSVK